MVDTLTIEVENYAKVEVIPIRAARVAAVAGAANPTVSTRGQSRGSTRCRGPRSGQLRQLSTSHRRCYGARRGRPVLVDGQRKLQLQSVAGVE